LKNPIQVPRIVGDYRRIYTPRADVYKGVDTPSFRSGQRYDEWITIDFTFFKGRDGRWHAIGITHPRPPGFRNAFDYTGDVHEAENQLFHCVYEGTLAELYASGCMTEWDKLLYPQERPGEPEPCWAPCAVETDTGCHLLYAPTPMRLAVSEDYRLWTPQGGLFEGPGHMRDPFVVQENGRYVMIYVTDDLCYRTSPDLRHWDEERLFQSNPVPFASAQESPIVLKRDGLYYLLWCVYDGTNGCYDNRTFVFASPDLYGFQGLNPVATLPAHAPEIVSEDGVDYIVSVFYPENGLNIAKLAWGDQQDSPKLPGG